MFRLQKTDGSGYTDLPDYIFENDCEFDFPNNTVVIDGVEYYINSILNASNVVENNKHLWIFSQGNRIEYVYFTGIEDANPSGSTDNIKQEIYKDSRGEIVLSINYEYDVTNKLIVEYSV